MTTNATIRSEKNKDTRKQLDVQRKERWANTNAISRMLPQTVMRMMAVSMKANNHGPLPVMFQSVAVGELPLKLPTEPDRSAAAEPLTPISSPPPYGVAFTMVHPPSSTKPTVMID
ncbi:hypothetical protein GOODEAATRI_014907 [Goodea atripinnis]|uniref:Uncharacterized protein n=1 Tax=Goodea atripinnis TaxID=208336 RepID=A0ABV0MI13_9TELE